jgi:signal transduction histidine kinase
VRRRILLLVVGMTTLVVVAFAVPIAVLIRSTVAQNARTATLNDARQVTLYVGGYSTRTKPEITAEVKSLSASADRPISVTLPDGSTVGSTPADSIGPPAATHQPGEGQPGGDGPDDRAAQGQLVPAPGGQVAVSVAGSRTGPYTVRVYLSADELYAGATRWYLLLAAASLGLLAIGVIAGELITRRITRPLVRTAETAQQLSVGDTTARAPTDGPREVADVGKALNRLADRIDELIAEERETVADLSHRLRTPLTTLRLDAEALSNPADADRVGGHVNELERTLTAVIHAARRPQREGRMPSCDATVVVGERVEFWSALTDEQGRSSDIALPDTPLPVRTAPGDLAAAVDALLENVIAHTPEGTAFAVRLTRTDAGARLDICDDGPGIPDEAEIRGRSDRGSSGLGLDIARRCAEASGGSMTIAHAPSGGALVTLDLHRP